MSEISTQKAVIVYAKQEINGITARPDSRAVMRKAFEGHRVEVRSGNDYINLYHVFERMAAGDKKLSKLKLVRKQIGHSTWHLFLVDPQADVPHVELIDGYDPKRGRYKRYAERLATGEALTLPDKAEATKARRAWQLYVPSENRRHLKSVVRKASRTGKYVVLIMERGTGKP